MMGNTDKNDKTKKGKREKSKEKRKARLLKELENSRGIISNACANAGCSRNTYYEYVNDDEEFAQKVREVTEAQIDIVEAALLRSIAKGEVASIIFYLKTKGKERGYVEKVEVEGNLGFIHLMKKASRSE